MGASGPVARKKIALIAASAVLVVLIIAWIDGGEEPVRAMTQSVAVPAGVSQ